MGRTEKFRNLECDIETEKYQMQWTSMTVTKREKKKMLYASNATMKTKNAIHHDEKILMIATGASNFQVHIFLQLESTNAKKDFEKFSEKCEAQKNLMACIILKFFNHV